VTAGSGGRPDSNEAGPAGQSGGAGETAAPILVVGYGNGLRRDDGVGCALAEEVGAWGRPDVRIMIVPQLYPEIAGDLATARRILFIDAEPAGEAPEVKVRRLRAREESLPLGHALSPEGVVGLAEEVYGSRPEAWVVTVPAFEFGWREELSPATAAFLPDARTALKRLLEPPGE
jgi:hydrogenase maturation protease